jgi:hypothetical protein
MAKTTRTAAANANLAEIGRRYLDFLRAEREHKRITAQDASRTISFRSEETLALRRAEARAREIPNQILDAEERTQLDKRHGRRSGGPRAGGPTKEGDRRCRRSTRRCETSAT